MILLLIIAMLLGSPMLLILVLFIMWLDVSIENDKVAERRHQELLDIEEKRLAAAKRKKSQVRRRSTRTVARDYEGRYIGQEIIEEYDDDDYDDDYDDYD